MLKLILSMLLLAGGPYTHGGNLLAQYLWPVMMVVAVVYWLLHKIYNYYHSRRDDYEDI